MFLWCRGRPGRQGLKNLGCLRESLHRVRKPRAFKHGLFRDTFVRLISITRYVLFIFAGRDSMARSMVTESYNFINFHLRTPLSTPYFPRLSGLCTHALGNFFPTNAGSFGLLLDFDNRTQLREHSLPPLSQTAQMPSGIRPYNAGLPTGNRFPIPLFV